MSSSAVIMVDTGLPSDTSLALEYAHHRPYTESVNIGLIVLTHLHLDHSDSICISNERRGVLVTGDVVLNFFGAGEFNNSAISDEAVMERTISRIRKLDLKGILPGHGQPLWGEDLAGASA